MEQVIYMKFEAESVDIMCNVNLEYREHIIEKTGKKVLYLQILKLYGKEQGTVPRQYLSHEDGEKGRNACTRNSRHILIRFVVVKDRVDKGKFTIEYCNTEAMLAAYFTKHCRELCL